MRNLFVCSLALAAGLMFSPDMLTLFGNSLGVAGWFFFLTIPVAVAVHLATIHSLQLLDASKGGHLVALQNYIGRRSATVIALGGNRYLAAAFVVLIG